MSDDDDDTFFVIILPVTIVIFVSIFTYLFVGYMRLKKHLLNSGQVISALPFLILPDEQPEIRSPDGQLPPPAYNAVVETEYENVGHDIHANNNNYGVVNYNHPSLTNFSLGSNATRRERRRTRARSRQQQANGPGITHVGPGEVQQSGPPSTEIMLERPPPVYSIECSTDVSNPNDRTSRRNRRKDTRERIPMSEIAPPPYSPTSEITVN